MTEPAPRDVDITIPDFRYRSPHNRIGAVCAVRVKTGPFGVAVLLTELPDNPGMSVTNASETLATEVLTRLRLADLSDDAPTRITWYEWYADGDGPLSRIRYRWDPDERRYLEPRWETAAIAESPFPELVERRRP